ncbi:hypothetical protein IU821_004699 [Salmonella enterica]|nr:hypothetical protein [Salmonella enterica]
MTAFIVLMVLVSGYLFSVNALPVRYCLKRSEGWGAYFFVAAWGVMFFAVGWVVCSVMSYLGYFSVIAHDIGISRGTIKTLVPLSGGGNNSTDDLRTGVWVVFSLAMSWCSGLLMKGWYGKGIRKYKAIADAARNNPFEMMAIESAAMLTPLMVTMKSQKIYVGWAASPSLEYGRIEYLSVIPLLSGFRNKNTLEVKFTTNYRRHYREYGVVDNVSRMRLDDFRVIIPASEIHNMSFFDFDAYLKFKTDNSLMPD